MADFVRLQEGLADRYRLERELGRGGMATVYLAQDLRHDRPVALKVLHPDLAATLGPERFQREIKLAARLQHPHILTVYDSGETAGQLWYTMPYVEGESLRSRLQRETQLSVDEAVRITCEAAHALQYAHDHGAIHRDIKPDNLLLAGDGHTFVADFGIGRPLDEFASGDPITATGVVVGTPAYIAPEQASGQREVDGRADVYSLAVVLYELLAGEPPFTGPTTQAILTRHFTEAPRALHLVRDTVPEPVERAVMKALAKAPADRFQTAAGFARALVTPEPTAPPQAAAGSSTAAPRRPRRNALAFAIVLLLVASAGLYLWQENRHKAEGINPGTRRLAVLPFANAGDDTSDRLFADGMAEEIATRLARVPGLSLVARSSALQYRRSTQTAPQFGRALRVDYVLDGTVRSAVDSTGEKQVRITPELIKVSDGTRVWGEPYQAELTDVFQLQADVAQQVAEALRGTLGRGEARAVRTGPTGDLEAFRLYLLGRAEWSRRTPENLERAADYFRQAIARDSTFARAYAGLADAYALYAYYGVRSLPRDTGYARAKAAALRAIALDSTLAEPHASLNQILRYGYWDWPGSERAVRRAIGLDSNYATAHQWLAEHLMSMGRLPEAITEARTAVQLEPLGPAASNVLGVALLFAGRTDEAMAILRTAVARDPTAGLLWRNLVRSYAEAGREGEALSVLVAVRDTSTFWRLYVEARSSSRARAAALDALGRPAGFRAVGGSHAVASRLYAYLGAPETALAELERAAAERDPRLEFIKVDPAWAPVRSNPRFSAVAVRMGLLP